MATRTINRSERILVYMATALVALSILDIIGLLVAAAVGAVNPWPVLVVFPLIALPVGFILMIVITVLLGMRRSREERSSAR